MADEVMSMVPGPQEQPIDLRKSPRKPLRDVPNLIPIGSLPSSFINQKQHIREKEETQTTITLPAMIFIPNANNSIHEDLVVEEWENNDNGHEQVERQEKLEGMEVNSNRVIDYNDLEVESCNKSRKRVRVEDAHGWLSLPLDRARSVPQLTPLPLPLQRSKSLSESRIPEVACAGPSQLLAKADDSRWLYLRYYAQMVRRCQAQQLLQQLALQHQTDMVNTKVSELSEDGRRRPTRPLTGRHVRPGTGASPATLLTLRRKIQARRQQHK